MKELYDPGSDEFPNAAAAAPPRGYILITMIDVQKLFPRRPIRDFDHLRELQLLDELEERYLAYRRGGGHRIRDRVCSSRLVDAPEFFPKE